MVFVVFQYCYVSYELVCQQDGLCYLQVGVVGQNDFVLEVFFGFGQYYVVQGMGLFGEVECGFFGEQLEIYCYLIVV